MRKLLFISFFTSGMFAFTISAGAVTLTMVFIPSGEFEMGDHFGDGFPDELPIHTVYVDSFHMSKYEITNSHYCDFLNSAYPSQIKVVGGIVYASTDSGNNYFYLDTYSADDDSQITFSSGTFSVRSRDGYSMADHPLVEVSWYGAVAYCNWLSQEEGYDACYDLSAWECDFSKTGYRLATEAEWEYAARGGCYYYKYPWCGNTIDCSKANFYDYYGQFNCNPLGLSDKPYTSPVGYYSANNYGLFDMAGNVREWCNDRYGSDYYNVSPYDNPTGPDSGSSRVLRSSSWETVTAKCRVAARNGRPPGERYQGYGFRVILTPGRKVTISGTVYDDSTGQPLSGVQVAATGANPTQTNANGQYEIGGLSAGHIVVGASKTGYGDSTKTIDNAEAGQLYQVDFNLIPDIESGFTPTENGFHFENPGINLTDDIGIGHCRGMTYTALFCYVYKITIPPETDWISNWVWSRLVELVHWETVGYSLTALQQIEQHSLEDNIQMIRNCLLEDIPCPLTLAPIQSHSVLAYKLTVTSVDDLTTYVIHIYDNRFPDTENHITIQCEGGSWSMVPYGRWENLVCDFLGVTGFYDDIRAAVKDLLIPLAPTIFELMSPASLSVTDPNGIVIDVNSPDVEGRYYRILDVDSDDHEEQSVIILDLMEGQYLVAVIPDVNAEPNDTYTLVEHKFGETSTIAEEVEIHDIPEKPYGSVVVLPTIGCGQAVTLLDYELVDQNDVNSPVIEYTFRLFAANTWSAELRDVIVQIVEEPNNTTVIDDNVTFSTIDAGAEAVSDDTFTIATSRDMNDVRSELIWEVYDCKLKRRTDFNDDWSVDLKDFAIFAQSWLECAAGLPEDVYPDGCINLMDLIIFSEEWLIDK